MSEENQIEYIPEKSPGTADDAAKQQAPATLPAFLPVLPAEGPIAQYDRAKQVAQLCKDIVVETSLQIQGRRFVRCEGWQAIANCFCCVASCEKVEAVEDGYRAFGVVRRISDGTIIATGEGFVGNDEPMWYGGMVRGKKLPKRPNYAIRAMAQTRAISRACRGPFAFVVVLMNANLEVCPAEEVPDGGFNDDIDETQPEKPQSNVPRGTKMEDDAGTTYDEGDPEWKSFPVLYGKKWAGAPMGSLPKNILWGYWKGHTVETEWNGKPISEDRIAKAQAFRDALDQAGAYYGFTK